MRIGVFGGVFDPPHLGHLLAADDVRQRLKLDLLLFVPTFRPPHKPGAVADFRDRLAMTRLAVKDWRGHKVSSIESAHDRPSYTVETVAALRRVYPGDSLYLIMGADQYREMDRWHRPREIGRLARIAVMDRPGTRRPPVSSEHSPRRVRFLPVVQVDIRSREIRDRLAKRRSVRYMLPTAVSGYIERKRLYRNPRQED
jgi:nicotinate-nucleotide adenylyltransferase